MLPFRPCLLALLAVAPSWSPARDVSFSKQKLTDQFVAEGAAAADFNGDGIMDVVGGPRWYAGPDYKKAVVYRSPHAFDRLSYSNNFLTFTDDFNGDNRPDILVIGWPGREAYWFENPGPGKAGDWPQHLAYFNVDTESPGFVDVNGDGHRDLVAGSGGRLGYMSRNPQQPTEPWTFHPVTPPGKWQRYTHGLGVGDINGDGRPDLLEMNGWWEQPANLAGNPVWKFHAQPFGKGGAQMYAHDVNGDGLADVITSIAAHGYGLSWFEQRRDAAGQRSWHEHPITSSTADEKLQGVQFSQPHAIEVADIDGDGLKDIVTGKRFWAHGDKGDPEPNAPAVLYWFRAQRGAGAHAQFTPHRIDDDSGVGCQFQIADLNGDGRPDLVIANKKGVFTFTQQR